MINIHLDANDISTNYYCAIFIDKVFSLVKSTYTKRTSVPPWSESNGGDQSNFNWLNDMVALFFDNIQISML